MTRRPVGGQVRGSVARCRGYPRGSRDNDGTPRAFAQTRRRRVNKLRAEGQSIRAQSLHGHVISGGVCGTVATCADTEVGRGDALSTVHPSTAAYARAVSLWTILPPSSRGENYHRRRSHRVRAHHTARTRTHTKCARKKKKYRKTRAPRPEIFVVVLRPDANKRRTNATLQPHVGTSIRTRAWAIRRFIPRCRSSPSKRAFLDVSRRRRPHHRSRLDRIAPVRRVFRSLSGDDSASTHSSKLFVSIYTNILIYILYIYVAVATVVRASADDGRPAALTDMDQGTRRRTTAGATRYGCCPTGRTSFSSAPSSSSSHAATARPRPRNTTWLPLLLGLYGGGYGDRGGGCGDVTAVLARTVTGLSTP